MSMGMAVAYLIVAVIIVAVGIYMMSAGFA